MTDHEFQTIAEQIDELEGALMEWDCRGDGATARLPWLHQIITDLMEASAPRPPVRKPIPGIL